MGRQNIAFLQTQSASGGTKCHAVAISPAGGTTPRTVNLTDTLQPLGHIFYTKTAGTVGDAIPPTHSGDAATGATIRIGINHGSFNTGTGDVAVATLCYQSGFLDSDITYGYYTEP